jgi:hypothetical protein
MWFHAMGSRMDLSPAQPKIELPDGPGRARQCRFCDPESSAECLYVPYKRVLSERLSGNINAVHADKRGIVPVVMTHQEVAAVLSRSCSQIVVKVKLDGRPELIAIHNESYDGIVHEHGFRETNCLASSALDAGP